MKVKDYVSFFEKEMPYDTAMDYDNVGLIIGDKNSIVTKVYLVLDLTISAIERAKDLKCELIISHHPLIFNPIKRITADNPQGRIIHELIKNNISYIALHTNLDFCDKYSNKVIADKIEGKDMEVHTSDEIFCGVRYDLSNEVSLSEFMEKVKTNLNASGVISINNPDTKVKKIFVQGGSFDKDSLGYILENDIDVVVSGEIKHDVCVLLESYNVATVIAGHNATERVYLDSLKMLIENNDKEVKIFVDYGNERNA